MDNLDDSLDLPDSLQDLLGNLKHKVLIKNDYKILRISKNIGSVESEVLEVWLNKNGNEGYEIDRTVETNCNIIFVMVKREEKLIIED